MVIGNGLVANAFKKNFSNSPDYIIFASGVSNSSENNLIIFEREKKLLENYVNVNKKLIYFSGVNVYDKSLINSPYVIHKKKMENIVKKAQSYNIFRLGLVLGITNNPNTLANFLYTNILENKYFEVWEKATRNIIDIDDVFLLVVSILQSKKYTNKIINIANPNSTLVINIIKIFENILKKNANFLKINTGDAYEIETTIVKKFALKLPINFNELYVDKVIKKYYQKIEL